MRVILMAHRPLGPSPAAFEMAARAESDGGGRPGRGRLAAPARRRRRALDAGRPRRRVRGTMRRPQGPAPTTNDVLSEGRAPAAAGRPPPRRAALLAVALSHAACGGGSALGPGPAPEPAAAPAQPGDDVGPIEPSAIEARHEGWRRAREEATPDPEAVRALRSAPRGAEVVVYLGVWCPDSQREVPRLWKAFEQAGGPLPFSVTYVGVDHGKRDPGGTAQAVGLRYVPTVIVRKGGREVGRVVESAPGGIERALADLLSGARSGVISERGDLGGR
jgi:hypothetical protein